MIRLAVSGLLTCVMAFAPAAGLMFKALRMTAHAYHVRHILHARGFPGAHQYVRPEGIVTSTCHVLPDNPYRMAPPETSN